MSTETGTSLNNGKVFGIPLGGFGLFSSLLLSLAAAFLSFFMATFLAIFGILIYNSVGHHAVSLAASYKFVALPVGLAVLVVSLGIMGTLWVRRKVSGR